MINSSKYYEAYTLQDAADISKFAIDTVRGLDRFIDFQDCVSEKIEMIAITRDDLKWLIKQELECKVC